MVEFFEAARVVLTGAWTLFASTNVPGLNISFAALFLTLLLCEIAIGVACAALGIGNSDGPHAGYRSGKGGKAKISAERRHDEK